MFVNLIAYKAIIIDLIDLIDLIAETEEQLQELTDRVNMTSARYGLLINKQKTKTMTIGRTGNEQQLKILLGGDELEQVKEFVYLGGLISQDGSCTADVKRRIGLASAVFGKLNRLWKSKKHNNVYKGKDVRNISHSSFHVWIRMLDSTK